MKETPTVVIAPLVMRRVIRRVQRSEAAKGIAAELGISYKSLLWRLHKAGIELRRGRKPPSRPPGFVEKFVRVYRKNGPTAAARAFGLNSRQRAHQIFVALTKGEKRKLPRQMRKRVA